MDRKSRHVTEIPCLAVDKLMSIFKPDPDDLYSDISDTDTESESNT